MAYNAVDATADNALQGLYLTPDMWYSAAHLTPRLLRATVDKMHKKQPLTADFENFSDRVNATYHLWDKLGGSQYLDDGLGSLMMMAADLATTYDQIRRAMYAAIDLATSILLRSTNAEDSAKYCRVIPAALDDMHIPDMEHVNVKTFHRILTVDPWLSWMERLRAQKQRTDAALSRTDAAEALAEGTADLCAEILITYTGPGLKKVPGIERAARKSIRKSTALFDRVLGVEARRDFLRSWRGQPLLVEGHRYDYYLHMRKDSLFKSTIDTDTRMSTVATVVYSKGGNRLCELCHYFHDTPVLDCVIATSLNVRNEETELDLLRAACVIDAPRGFYDDPVLPELKGLLDPTTAPTLVENVFNHAGTLPLGQQSALRDTLRKDALPLAYVAFKAINHIGKQYLPLSRVCGELSMWDFMHGVPDATPILKLVQRAHQQGNF